MISGWPGGGRCQVTVQAILVIRTQIAHEFLVGIVAGYASEASIPLRSPAPALFQAIGLGPYVGHPYKTSKFDVPPGTVARTAEICGINRVELGGIENRARFLSGLLCDYVIETRPVTRFTGDPEYHAGPVKFVIDCRGGRVACETTDQLSAGYGPPHRLLESRRLGKAAARRERETFQSIEVRNAAFVEISAALEQVRLANMAVAKRPSQWSGDAMRTIRNRVNSFAFSGPDLVTDWARLKSEPTIHGQNG
jgi:hypothetical protein